ncbi:MAG: PQQ-binding-like beta-propeller repeat protein [Myxococcales bacterium]|nr:PQQ-binding-like beta-propeller repeat protein [Myxococcales bacterium]
MRTHTKFPPSQASAGTESRRLIRVARSVAGEVTLRLAVAATLSLAACSASVREAVRVDDPATPIDVGPPRPLFDAPGLPLAATGAPLRASAVEGEWRTLRGDGGRSGTRLAPGIITPTMAWSAHVGIQGYLNTPLLGGDVVYASSQGDMHDMPDPSDGFYALDARTGAQRWFYATNEDVNGAMLTDTLVIGGTDDGTLYAVDRATGELAWSVELSNTLNQAPTALGTRLLVGDEDGVDVLDASTGRFIERFRGGADGWDARGGFAVAGGAVIRSAASCRVFGYDADEGDVAWEALACPTGEEATSVRNYSVPTLVGSMTLLATPHGDPYGLFHVTLSLRSSRTGEALWDAPLERVDRALGMYDGAGGFEMSYFAVTPWVMGGLVWMPMITAPYLVGLDVGTGDLAAAAQLPSCSGRQFASIVGVPSRGYLPRHEGTLYAFSPTTGQLAWAYRLGVRSQWGTAQPATPSNTGYSDGYCYGAPYDGTGLFATPSIGEDGTLFVGTGEGYIVALRDASWR